MLVDERTSTPTLFLEKEPKEVILRVLKEAGEKCVYFNAFYFAMTKRAALKLLDLYAKRMTHSSNGKMPFYLTYDFDWSRHIIEV